jgi:hypothetical protein
MFSPSLAISFGKIGHYGQTRPISVDHPNALVLLVLPKVMCFGTGWSMFLFFHVVLYSLSANRFNQSTSELAKLLNQTETAFPGTALSMVYKISGNLDCDK